MIRCRNGVEETVPTPLFSASPPTLSAVEKWSSENGLWCVRVISCVVYRTLLLRDGLCALLMAAELFVTFFLVFGFVFCSFFLFSDQLVYAHQLFSGDWKMHEQLLLALVKVVDVQVSQKRQEVISRFVLIFFFVLLCEASTALRS